MELDKQIKTAKYYLERNLVSVNERTARVGDHIILIKKSPGKIEMNCDCNNGTRFNKINPLCSHKIAVINYLSTFNLQKKLDNLIFGLEQSNTAGIKLDTIYLIQQLKDIKRL